MVLQERYTKRPSWKRWRNALGAGLLVLSIGSTIGVTGATAYASTVDWTNVGTNAPANITAFTQANGFLYAGTSDGKLYEYDLSKVNGGTWTQFGAGMSFSGIGGILALVVIGQTVYISADPESTNSSGYIVQNPGVFSYDLSSGTNGSWTQIASPPSSDEPSNLSVIGGTLYADSGLGSSDLTEYWYNGSTWNQLTSTIPYYGGNGEYITQMEWDGTLYISKTDGGTPPGVSSVSPIDPITSNRQVTAG